MKFSFSRSKVSLSIYILFLISYMIQTSNLYNQYGHFAKGLIVSIYVLAYILATLLLSTQKYTFKSITWICFLLVVGICVFKVNYQSDVIESLTVFNMMIMIISSKNIDIDEYIRKDIIVRTSTTIILFLLSISGIITNIVTSLSLIHI